MSIESQIKSAVAKLNRTWFIGLKAEYIAHPFYDRETGMLKGSFTEYLGGFNPDTGELVDEFVDVLVQATLPEFAWEGALYASELPEELQLPTVHKARFVPEKIFEIVEPILGEIKDIKQRYNLIESVVKYIVDCSEELKSQETDVSYHEVVDHCIRLIRLIVSNKYKLIKKAHDGIVDYDDKLYFDMTQKDLSFLLALLIRSHFIYGWSTKNSTVNAFFSKYFYFKNQKAGNSFQRAKDINKKISDVFSPNNTDYKDIKEEMKARLIDAIREL
jgi:hypothetical protein